MRCSCWAVFRVGRADAVFTGATGNIGRLVVDHLLTAGATEIRALTASPAKAALPAALEGVDRMYLAPLPQTVREVTLRRIA